MKILMTVTLAMLVSASVFAECKKEGDSCTKDECAKLGTGLSLNTEGKCVKVGSTEQSETQCASILNSTGAKGAAQPQGASQGTPGAAGKNQ